MVNAGGIYIAIGSNLGDRAATIDLAIADLTADGLVRLLRRSPNFETAPEGGPPGQGPYLNAAIEVDTALPPEDLLRRMQSVELRHGRTREERFGPRTLDLDLLLYRDTVSDDPHLTLPHPRMWQRRFVLEPLATLCNLGQLRARFDRLTDRSDPPAQ